MPDTNSALFREQSISQPTHHVRSSKHSPGNFLPLCNGHCRVIRAHPPSHASATYSHAHLITPLHEQHALAPIDPARWRCLSWSSGTDCEIHESGHDTERT